MSAAPTQPAAAYSLEVDDDETNNTAETPVVAATTKPTKAGATSNPQNAATTSTAAGASASASAPVTGRHAVRSKAASNKKKRAVNFRKDLKSVMYGFGDEWNPLAESVDFMDQVVKEYIQGMVSGCWRGNAFAHSAGG
jgi:hypothetical protein